MKDNSFFDEMSKLSNVKMEKHSVDEEKSLEGLAPDPKIRTSFSFRLSDFSSKLISIFRPFCRAFHFHVLFTPGNNPIQQITF